MLFVSDVLVVQELSGAGFEVLKQILLDVWGQLGYFLEDFL